MFVNPNDSSVLLRMQLQNTSPQQVPPTWQCMHSLCPSRGHLAWTTYAHQATFRRVMKLVCHLRIPEQPRSRRLCAAAQSAGREPTDEGLLSWSPTEDSSSETDDTEAPAHNGDAAGHATGKAGPQRSFHQSRQQQQQQQRPKTPQHQQQQQEVEQLPSGNGEQQHRHAASAGVDAGKLQPPSAAAPAALPRQRRKQGAADVHLGRSPPQPPASSNKENLSSPSAGYASGYSQGRQDDTAQAAAAGDGYREAQERVRAVLAAADISNPEAAAEQLPGTVNDLTIALQLLATAPRPNTLAAYRQYQAAVQTLAAAVLGKYKRLLLSELAPPLHPSEVQQGQQQEKQRLAAALAVLPATKLAATTFSLGVLRLYDAAMVEALEDASLQLMSRGAFKPNQLGQIVQGFLYLDHMPRRNWHEVFMKSTRRHLGGMQGAQVASLAVWLTTYHLCGASSSSCGSGSTTAVTDVAGGAQPLLRNGAAPLAAAAAVVASKATGSAGTHSLQPDPAWVQAYLAAVGGNAASLKPLQLAQVLHATAALCHMQQAQQQQWAVDGQAWKLPVGQGSPALLLPAALQAIPVPVQGWPAALPPTAAVSLSTGRSSSTAAPQNLGRQRPDYRQHPQQPTSLNSSCTGSSWVLPLVAALQRKLPELTMAHLAAALPPFLVLTQHPWPQEVVQPLLLQVSLLLPGSSGKDLIAVAQTVAQLAGPGVLAADVAWCDAVVTQLHAQLPALGPAELAGAVHIVAALRVKPYKAWLYALCQRLRVDAKAMDAGQVLMVLEGLAQMGVQLDPEVLHVYVLGIKRWMGSLHLDDIKRLVSALKRMYPKVLPGRTVQQLVEELQRRQQYLALQAQLQQMLVP